MDYLTLGAWIVFALAQAADVITTIIALRQPGLRESNPVIRWVMTRAGRWWWAVKFAIALVAALVLMRAGAPLAVLALGLVTGVVAGRNWLFIRHKQSEG